MRVAPVLIVEDDADTQEALNWLLAEEGYAVAVARDGTDALGYLRSTGDLPCMMLIDLKMSPMTGWELLGELGRDARLAGIPVIVLTALQNPIVPAGVTLLSKPIDKEHLLAAVGSKCRRRANAARG
jgi:CheY-like chemotaxis protein